jgi:hypothetical protein
VRWDAETGSVLRRGLPAEPYPVALIAWSLPRRRMTGCAWVRTGNWWARPTSGMLSSPLFRKIFFVRELVQAVLYLLGGSGKKLAAYQV